MRHTRVLVAALLAAAGCNEAPSAPDAAATARDAITATDLAPADAFMPDVPAVSSDIPAVPIDTPASPSDIPAVPIDTPVSPSDTPAVPTDAPAASIDIPAAPTDAGRPPEGARVFYAGGARADRFNTAVALADGTFVLGGGADDLDWIPAAVPRTTLSIDGLAGSPGGARVAFLLHLSADLGTPLHVVQLPPGAATEIRHIRLTGAPGDDLYISGYTTENRAAGTGSFVARLDGGFIGQRPTRARWVRNWYASGTHRSAQPWDVGSDGRVTYAAGEPFSPNWAAVYRLRPDGTDDVVPDWRYHWGTRADGSRVEGSWTPASSRPDVTVTQSGIVFKTAGRCDLRSWTAPEYTARTPDGNGGTRQGAWPMDLFFNGPCDPARPTHQGPGYTGYSMGANPTQMIGAIAVDRRSNDLYIGFSTQSRLPDGQPDFEPAVIAMTASGRMKWWSRLYTESAMNSTPDQYVDRLAVDPSTGELVVLARCHGNNTVNLWRGDAVAARPGSGSFHNQFTGSSGNIHISWLGRFAPGDGTLRAASYLAEYADGLRGAGAPYSDPLLDGWPSHNAGWPELNTTRAESLAVSARGEVLVIATGRRTITTRNAFMRMPQPAMGFSGWNDFVRAFTPDLGALRYSSILRSPWNPAMDGGDGNVKLMHVVPAGSGALVVGYHVAAADGSARGAAMPTAQIPAWGSNTPRGESAVVAWLPW